MMKIRNFNLAIVVLAGAVLFTGCSLPKMIKLASQQKLEVNPNPLELHGEKVDFNVSATLPAKMLPSGKVYTISTIYKYGDQSLAVGDVEFKADEFPSSSTQTSRKSQDFSMNYVDDMNPGTLVIQGTALDPRNGKSAKTAEMEIAVGVITTSRAVKDSYIAAFADHGYNMEEELIPTNVNFYFPQGSSQMIASLSTDGESNRTKQRNLAVFIADKNVTRTVTITGTHSPEGPERINSNLSKDRATQIEKYYRSQMKRYDYKGMADSIKFIIKPVVEDWTEFRMALRDYDLDESKKQEFVRIISGTGTFEDKEKALQKLPSYKKVFEDIYPTLRTAKTEILTVKVKKDKATISALSKQVVGGDVNNDTLSTAELLYSASLTPDLDEKAAIYQNATKRDGIWIAHNNLAAVYLTQARENPENRAQLVQDAVTQLEIAANKSQAAEIQANLASAYIMQRDYAKAYEALGKAEGSASNDLKGDIIAAKGSIEIRQANYAQAKATLASAADTETTFFNRGLVNILTKEYALAGGMFDKATDTSIGADAYYYKAVAAARAKDTGAVVSNLKEAVTKDASLKDKALNDLEFVNLADAVAQALR
jgi:tetratricopeptide (TPR) repeat protein